VAVPAVRRRLGDPHRMVRLKAHGALVALTGEL
jgi:hypothetical protein